MAINPYEKHDIGIELFSLNILRNPRELNLSYIKKKMKNKEFTRYAIVFTDKLSLASSKIELKGIFAEFWERGVLNVIIVFWTNELNVFTYTPFDESFLVSLNVSEFQPDLLFYDKTKNLNGDELKVGMFYEPQRAKILQTDNTIKLQGIDGRFTKMVMKSMNATLKLIEPMDEANLGELFPNGSTSGVFAQFQNGIIDMSFNARFFRMKHFRDIIEPTLTIGRDDLCILVPRSGISLNLDNIFDVFELTIWILIIASLPIYAFVFYLYDRKNQSFRKPISFIHALLRLFGWNLNQPYMQSPKSILAKFMLGIWITYSALITNFYNSNLTSYLMVKPPLSDITTLQQLAQSNLQILTLQKYTNLINEFLNSSYPNLLGRCQSVDTLELYTHIVSRDKSYAYAHKEHVLRYALRKGRLFDTFSQMHECAVPFIDVYALRLGSPYKGRVNWILSQAQETGIIDHWLEIGLHRQKMNQAHRQKSQGDQHVPISISHLQSTFYILLLGCVASFLVFLCEISFANLK